MKTFVAALALVGALSATSTVADSQMTALTVLTQNNNLIQFGTLNVTTGEYKHTSDLDITLQDSTNCFWAPLQGTEGVGTATFHGNRSYFILAQQLCGSPAKVNQTVLISTHVAMYADPASGELLFNASASSRARRQHAKLGDGMPGYSSIWHTFPGDTYNFPLSSWNMVWDHTCNYIVVAPRRDAQTSDTVYETWMISEYDAAPRQQKDLTRQPPRLKAGWVKADGLGAMDFYGATVGGPYKLNCGDNCSLYALEDFQGRGQNTPTRIVGRNFHTGEVLSNVTNTLDVRMLASPSDMWSIDYKDFLMVGLGRCCAADHEHANDAEWCDQSDVCKSAPGAMTIAAYGGAGEGRFPLTALTTIGSSTSDYNSTLKLGLVMTFGPMGESAPESLQFDIEEGAEAVAFHAYVLVDNTVETYQVVAKNQSGVRTWGAQKVATSGNVGGQELDAWTIGPISWNW